VTIKSELSSAVDNLSFLCIDPWYLHKEIVFLSNLFEKYRPSYDPEPRKLEYLGVSVGESQ
jgi:hypothetical protein